MTSGAKWWTQWRQSIRPHIGLAPPPYGWRIKATARPKIEVPTLILVGEEDRITPVSLSEELHELIPQSELQIIGKAGHLANAEQAQAFNSAIESFLSQQR